MAKLSAAVVGLSLVVGCAQLASTVQQDAQTAAAIDPANAACYNGIGDLAAKVPNGGGGGVLTGVALIEQKRALMRGPCAPVVIDIASEIKTVTPSGFFGIP
jgi:hypothetical protein